MQRNIRNTGAAVSLATGLLAAAPASPSIDRSAKGGYKNTFDSIKAFSETDLAKLDVPTLILHGDDDQLVPIDNSARASHRLIKTSKLIVYKDGPHGITDTHKHQLNRDLLTFVRG